MMKGVQYMHRMITLNGDHEFSRLMGLFENSGFNLCCIHNTCCLVLADSSNNSRYVNRFQEYCIAEIM